MSGSGTSLAKILYFILGLVVLYIIIQVAWWLLRMVAFLVAVVLTIVITLAIGYLIYLGLRSLTNKM